MDKTLFKSGVMPSPPDERDYPIAKLVATVNVFPDEFCCIDLTKWELQNQSDIGSCVAHSLAYTRAIKEYQQSKDKMYKKFSPGFIYANRTATDYHGEGMYPREALANLKNYGCCLYEEFPYNEQFPTISTKFESIKTSLYPKAAPYKISAYARLYNESDIKNALMQLGPVTIMTAVYDGFWNTMSRGGVIEAPKDSSEQNYGYHETTIAGWNKQGYILLNSWANFGVEGKGYGILPYNYPIIEAWSITDNILPNPDPSPTPKYYRVQVGAFSAKPNAEKIQTILKAKGFNSYLTLVNNLYKVQCGAFSVQPSAVTLSNRITQTTGYKCSVVYY